MSRAEFIHRTIIVVGLLLIATIIGAVIIRAADVLLVFFGGVLLAVLLRSLADLLAEHARIPARAALVVVTATLLVLLAVGVWLLAAELSSQFDQLGGNLGRAWTQLQERLEREAWGRQLLSLVQRAQADPARDASVASEITQGFSTTLGALANFLVILFIGIYVAANPQWYVRGFLRLVRPAQRARAREILAAIAHTLRWWLFGRAVGMVIVGAATTIGLSLLDAPLALSLGLIAGALDFVPFVGPIAAAAPGVMVALTNGPTYALQVAALYLAIQLIEGYVLTPLIEQRSVHLPPAVTIGAQVLLGVLVGAVGVLFATPLAAVIVVVVKRLYVEDALEHRRAA